MKVANKSSGSLPNVDATKTSKLGGDRRTSSKSSVGSSALEGTAKINVSERAQAMQKAKDIASNRSVDEAKVARLQKMIDDGKYRVDAKAVADRLVDEHIMMAED